MKEHLTALAATAAIVAAYTGLCTLAWGASAWYLGTPETGPCTGSFTYGAKMGLALSVLAASAALLTFAVCGYVRSKRY